MSASRERFESDLSVALRALGAWALALVLVAALSRLANADSQAPLAGIRATLDTACVAAVPRDAVLHALGGGIELGSDTLTAPRGLDAIRHRLLLPDGRRVRLDIHRRAGRLQRLILELSTRIAGELRPSLWLVTDAACSPSVARQIRYDERGVASEIVTLDRQLRPTPSRIVLDAPLPVAHRAHGVAVALVDSGVNYTLPAIAERLARRADGSIVGYDFWDMDPRPFDAHLTRNAFFPQRHGTATASILLDDAPLARIAPYRYPRPDMSRMTALVEHVDAAGIRIVNLSMGGVKRSQWSGFERAARAHPHILFIVSAGNDGRDIDQRPVYPASLSLDNLVTVTSAGADGRPAPGSNWGRRRVHLMVPAQSLVGLGFDGYARELAGSSYAAARVSALAACLLAANRHWQAPQLRAALFERARQGPDGAREFVKEGLIDAPTAHRRGGCGPEPVRARRTAAIEVASAEWQPIPVPAARLSGLDLYLLQDSGWELSQVVAAVREAAPILAQCGVGFGRITVHSVAAPRSLRYFSYTRARQLVAQLEPASLTAWFVRDTLEPLGFDAQAIGRSNGRRHPSLVGSIWLTSHLERPGPALAHELYHVLADTGGHVPETDNLMHQRTVAGATRLTEWQCERLRKVSRAFGWLLPAAQSGAAEAQL